jgi:hypothetical protein
VIEQLRTNVASASRDVECVDVTLRGMEDCHAHNLVAVTDESMDPDLAEQHLDQAEKACARP